MRASVCHLVVRDPRGHWPARVGVLCPEGWGPGPCAFALKLDFFWGGNNLLHNPHTHGPTTSNNSSVLIHLAAGKVTSAGGRVGIRERHSPWAAPTTVGVRRSSELGRGAMRRRHWCSKKLGGVGRLSDGLAAEKPGVVVSPGGGAVAWLLCAHTALNN